MAINSGLGIATSHVHVTDFKRATNSYFNLARLIVVGLVVRVKRRFSVATGCCTRLQPYFRESGTSKPAARIASVDSYGNRVMR